MNSNIDSFLYRLTPKIAIVGVFFYLLSLNFPIFLNFALIFIGISGVLLAVYGYRNQFIGSRWHLFLPIGIFIFLSFLSITISLYPQRSLFLTLPLIPALLIYILIIEVFHINHIRFIYIILSIVSLIICIDLLQVVFTHTTLSPSDLIIAAKHPLLVVPNDLIFLSLITPLSLTLFYQKPSSLIGTLAILSILLTIAVIILFQSRGGLLILLISMGIVAGTLWPKRWIVVVSILLVVIIIGVDLTQNFSLFHKFTSSWNARLLPWLIAWDMFMDAPLLGNGIHTFGVLYETYKQTIDLPVGITIDTRTMAWAHNFYLETLAEQGIVGMVSLGIVLSHGLLLSWQIRTNKQQDIRIMNVGALASLLSFCLASIFEISLIRYWCVTILFLLLAIITVCYCFSFNGGVND